MIREVTMYTVVCDSCGKDVSDGTEYACWNTRSYALMEAEEADWAEEEEKDYCPDCHTYDGDDKLIVKPKKGEK